MIRVLVADDHTVVRRGVAALLAETRDISVCGEAATAAEALGAVEERPCDLLLLDLNLPGSRGLELLSEVRRRRPRLAVLVFTVFAEELFAVRALRAGAAGYLTKDAAPELLLQAIRKVARGGRYVSPDLAERLAAAVTRDEAQPLHHGLSDREYAVMRLLASGRSVGEIARELALSVKTVSTYRTRLMEKLALRTNADLTRYALEHRLVD